LPYKHDEYEEVLCIKRKYVRKEEGEEEGKVIER
jgi:hypothetical protein